MTDVDCALVVVGAELELELALALADVLVETTPSEVAVVVEEDADDAEEFSVD